MQPELREQCQHRWADILTAFDVGERFLNGKHQSCPLCGGKDRARYTDYLGNGSVYCNQCGSMDGIDFLQRWTQQSFSDIAKSIRMIIGETKAQPKAKQDNAKVKARLKSIWMESKPLSKNDASHRYLFNRGLDKIKYSDITNLRTHAELPYWEVENNKPVLVGKFPAMIALVNNDAGKAATLQCTYLTDTGEKANVENARKTMPPYIPWVGGAVRLGAIGENKILCIAEGVETALSLKQIHPEFCVWACINAGNMEKFVPPDITSIVIGGDNDASFTGQAAAFALAKRLAGKKQVTVLIPDREGTDWNDYLVSGGVK